MLYAVPSQNFVQKTLSADLLSGVTASATLNNATNIQNLPGVMIVDRVDSNGTETLSKREVILYTGVSGSTVTTLTRNADGSGTDQDHAVGAIVEFSPDVLWAQGIYDALTQTINPTTGLPLYTTNVMKPTAPYVAVGSDATGDIYFRGAGGTLSRLALGSSTQVLTANASLPYWEAGSSALSTMSSLSLINPNSTGADSGAITLTNKRIEPRIVTAASYTTDTGTSLTVATADQFQVTAQAGALLFNAPGGTPVAGQKLIIRIKDDGTARALTWNAVFRAMGAALPSTTVLGKTLYMGFIFNVTDTKWDLVASAQEA